jgi:GAF domain-containing protein
VTGQRRLRILSRLVGFEGPGLETKRLCEVCAEVSLMTGAGIMLMSGDMPRGSVCSSDTVSHVLEELQYSLGEGPCIDAYQQGSPVLEPDLADPRAPRWIAFSGPALQAGARAVFGFPLQVGAVSIGSLDLYRDRPGGLTDDQHADALVLADIAAQSVLMLQANAPPGKLAAELEAGADFQYVVHQAAGMVAVQLGVGIGQALVRLRAYAFGNERPLAEVARHVVGRTLRFDDGPDDRDVDR